MLEWAYVGVNISVPRNGGEECSDFVSMKTRMIETVIVVALTIPAIYFGLKNITPVMVDLKERREPFGKRFHIYSSVKLLITLRSFTWLNVLLS